MQAAHSGETGRGPHGSPPKPVPPMLLSIDEARRELGNIGKTTIFAMIKSDEIEAVKVGRRTMIVTSSCLAYIASRPRIKADKAA